MSLSPDSQFGHRLTIRSENLKGGQSPPRATQIAPPYATRTNSIGLSFCDACALTRLWHDLYGSYAAGASSVLPLMTRSLANGCSSTFWEKLTSCSSTASRNVS